jgi:O-antigen ligase
MPQSEEHLSAPAGAQSKPTVQAASRLDRLIIKLEKTLAVVTCVCAAALPLPITWSWIALILGICVWVAWKVALRTRQKNFSGIALGPLSVPLFTFFAASAISGCPMWFGHKQAPLTFDDFAQSVESLRTFVIYFWAFDVFWNFPDLRRIAIACLLVSASGSGIFGAFEQLFNWHPGYKFLQGTGFQSGPMAFAGQMQIFCMLALGFIVGKSYRVFPRPLSNKFVYGLLVAANVVGVLFASERNAWLGFLVAFIFWATLVSRQLMLRGLFILTICAAFAWFCVPVVQTRLRPLMDWQHEVSSKARLIIWQKAIGYFEFNPITGLGATKFPRQDMPEAIVPGRSVALDHAHSNYLQVLATTGVLGLISYLYMVIATIACAWQNYIYRSSDSSLRSQVDKAIALSIICATVSLLVSGIFEYNFGTGPVRLPQWFVIALIGRAGDKGDHSGDKRKRASV